MIAIIHQILYKLVSVVVSISMLLGSESFLVLDSTDWNTNYKYVFVHGLSGWGSYDAINNIMPYWGMLGGDLMEYLEDKGFDCYAASVAPNASAWDRACELYAQLTGTVVDYGKEHSERCNHKRFGEDYTGRALIDSFSETDKINLLGHSFGGATVRLFASLMETGSEAEKQATDENDLSEFFKGGKGDFIYSVTTLAAPHNGTTAYSVDRSDLENDYPDDTAVFGPAKTKIQAALIRLMTVFTDRQEDDRLTSDTAAYDMYIDNALALNEKILTLENTYYFSYPCRVTTEDDNANQIPDESKTEIMFLMSARAIGQYTGKTENGYVIDETWKENDGLVNTISATAPLNALSTIYDPDNVRAGIWNIMPLYTGDHMSLQGGLTKVNDIKPFYVELLDMINKL